MEPNPITTIRFRNGYTAQALAKRLNLSSQYVDRVEQGIYEAPTPKLMEWCVENSAMLEDDILEEYHQWRFLKREDTLARLNLKPISRPGSAPANYMAFKLWREYYWDTSFQCAKSLCVPHTPVANYEEVGGKMPKPLRETLVYLGLIPEVVNPCKTTTSKTGNGK